MSGAQLQQPLRVSNVADQSVALRGCVQACACGGCSCTRARPCSFPACATDTFGAIFPISSRRQRDAIKTKRHHPSSGFHPSFSILPLLQQRRNTALRRLAPISSSTSRSTGKGRCQEQKEQRSRQLGLPARTAARVALAKHSDGTFSFICFKGGVTMMPAALFRLISSGCSPSWLSCYSSDLFHSATHACRFAFCSSG